MPDYAATVELRHPKGAVTITVTSASPELAAHVANTIRTNFNAPAPRSDIDDILRRFGATPRNPFVRNPLAP